MLTVGDADADAVAQRLEAARLALGQAIELEPEYADPYCFMAIVEFQFLDDADAALPYVETCEASNPPSEIADLIDGVRRRHPRRRDAVMNDLT